MSEQQSETQSGGEDRDWSRPVLSTTSVGALGPQLPLGVAQGAGFGREVAVRPWRMKEERVLGNRRDEDENRNMGKYVSIVLATMCTKLGGNDWSALLEKGTAERELVISQMYMGDVFYAYVWLRIQAMGKELPMTLTCGRCQGAGAQFDWTGDLMTVEVKVPENLEAALWHYTLHVPIEVRGKTVSKFIMGPPRWHHVESMGDSTMGGAKSRVIHAHLYALPEVQDGEIAVGEHELDELSKRDIEELTNRINDNGFGPKMSIDCKCPKGHPINEAIDWRFDSFFGISSPSPA